MAPFLATFWTPLPAGRGVPCAQPLDPHHGVGGFPSTGVVPAGQPPQGLQVHDARHDAVDGVHLLGGGGEGGNAGAANLVVCGFGASLRPLNQKNNPPGCGVAKKADLLAIHVFFCLAHITV